MKPDDQRDSRHQKGRADDGPRRAVLFNQGIPNLRKVGIFSEDQIGPESGREQKQCGNANARQQVELINGYLARGQADQCIQCGEQ